MLKTIKRFFYKKPVLKPIVKYYAIPERWLNMVDYQDRGFYITYSSKRRGLVPVWQDKQANLLMKN